MQPSHLAADSGWAVDRVGRKRLKDAYSWLALLRAGARVAGGSDAPVDLLDPLVGMYVARTRKDREGRSLPGWKRGDCLEPMEALRMYTADAS